jgi:transposase InsO family protein
MGMDTPTLFPALRWRNSKHIKAIFTWSDLEFAQTLLFDLDDARAKIANWVAGYNIRRPHSSLKYLTPAAYAAHLTATDDRLRNP